MRLLLDTHAFLWFVTNNPLLSAAALALTIDPTNEILVSPASYWEVAIKVSIGKYPMIVDFERFFSEGIEGNDAIFEGNSTMSGTATPTDAEQLAELIERVKTWPLSMRIALAKQVLDTLDVPIAVPTTRGRPVEELIGIGAGASPPPDDDQVRSWIDEHRTGKYG